MKAILFRDSSLTAFLPALIASAACLLAPAAAASSQSTAVPITALAFSPDGATLVSNGPRCVDIRSPKDGAVHGHIACDLPKITALMFHPSGEILSVTGGEPGVRGEVRLMQWRTRTVYQRFTNAQDVATSVAFNTDGTLLGVGGADHKARLWRRPDPGAPFAEIFTLTGHAGPVLAVVFSPTGRIFVTGSADRSIKVWSTEDGRLLRTFTHHLEAVNALAVRPFAAGGETVTPCALVSASDDRTVRVWQPEIGRMVRIIRQHRAPVFALACAPDGRSLFSAGPEGVIRQFDADSDTLISGWPGHADWIYALAISPDGSRLASGDWSGAVKLHDLRARNQNQNHAASTPGASGQAARPLSRSGDDLLAGLRRFYARTARPDGSFANGVDPQYRGMSDSAYSDLAAVTYAVTLHKTFGWKLPHEEATRRFLFSRQQTNGDFFNVSGTVDPKSAEGRVYNTTQGIVALRALGAKPRYDPLRVFEEILQQDYKTLPAYSTSFFPLAYLAYGQSIPAEADRRIRATMLQAADGYLNNHVAATFHAAHYHRLVGTPTPMPEHMIGRVLRDQKSDGSWLLNLPSRDRHATFDAVFILRQLGYDRADCRAAIERAARWARSCRNADGGFGHFPGSTSDADANYFQVGTLVMAGYLKPAEPLPNDAHLLSWGHLMPLTQNGR